MKLFINNSCLYGFLALGASIPRFFSLELYIYVGLLIVLFILLLIIYFKN